MGPEKRYRFWDRKTVPFLGLKTSPTLTESAPHRCRKSVPPWCRNSASAGPSFGHPREPFLGHPGHHFSAPPATSFHPLHWLHLAGGGHGGSAAEPRIAAGGRRSNKRSGKMTGKSSKRSLCEARAPPDFRCRLLAPIFAPNVSPRPFSFSAPGCCFLGPSRGTTPDRGRAI